MWTCPPYQRRKTPSQANGRFTDLKDKALLLSTNEKLSANITPEEVEVLITGGVKLLGVDAMSVEHSDDLVVHRKLLSSGCSLWRGWPTFTC